MCGIAGILSWDRIPSEALIRAMTQEMSLRGPDAEGIYVNQHIGLGHRRLAIIDTSDAGTQPLFDTSGCLCIVFNGEIYNYQELKANLSKKGVNFRTNTDTEVILEAYKIWGEDCLSHLNGMFAFAIWDITNQSLFLARDRLGEKPLFYSILPGGDLIFASELKALLRTPYINQKICYQALGQYLSLGYTLAPLSMIEGVNKLEPAHALSINRDRKLKKWEYWSLAPHFSNKRNIGEKQAKEELQELIYSAVEMRMISDVPLGAFLSGGVDSSTLVAGMTHLSRKTNQSTQSIRTFSTGFQEKSYSELNEAAATAKFLGVHHLQQIISPAVSKDINQIFYAADEPLADNSLIPMFYLSEFAKKHVTVSLSGDGGDELFGGYETYSADIYHNKLNWIPNPLIKITQSIFDICVPVSFNKVSFDFKMRRFLSGLLLPFQQAHYSWRQLLTPEQLKKLLVPAIRERVFEHDPFTEFQRKFQDVKDCHYLDQAMYVDIKTWLPDDILVKADRSSMAHSLELRCPFLDHRLVEFAASLPVALKITRLKKKYILKESQRENLPNTILDRPKKGFNAPISSWLKKELRDVFITNVMESASMEQFFSREYLELLLSNHMKASEDNSFGLYAILALQTWIDRHVRGQPLEVGEVVNM